jgi:hypothetical protein
MTGSEQREPGFDQPCEAGPCSVDFCGSLITTYGFAAAAVCTICIYA